MENEKISENCFILFDDYETLQYTKPKLYKIIIGLINTLVSMGRHQKLDMAFIVHNVSNYASTRVLLQEATHLVIYPNSCSITHLKHLFGKYGSVDNNLIKSIKNFIEHLFNVHTNCDKCWCHEKQAEEDDKEYILNKNHTFYCKKR